MANVKGLVDGVARNAEHPQTFHIPSAAEKAALRPGDWVKVGFVFSDGKVERMWVLIKSIDGSVLEGSLDNEPLNDGARLGDRVVFSERHVLGILHESDKPMRN